MLVMSLWGEPDGWLYSLLFWVILILIAAVGMARVQVREDKSMADLHNWLNRMHFTYSESAARNINDMVWLAPMSNVDCLVLYDMDRHIPYVITRGSVNEFHCEVRGQGALLKGRRALGVYSMRSTPYADSVVEVISLNNDTNPCIMLRLTDYIQGQSKFDLAQQYVDIIESYLRMYL